MKTKILLVMIALTAASTSAASAQGFLDRIADRVAKKAEDAITRKAEQAVDKAMDKVTDPETYKRDEENEPAQPQNTPPSQSQQPDNDAPVSAPTAAPQPAATQAPAAQTAAGTPAATPAPTYSGSSMTIEQMAAKYADNQNGVTVMTMQGQFAQQLAQSSSKDMGGADMSAFDRVKSFTIIIDQRGVPAVTEEMYAILDGGRYTTLSTVDNQGIYARVAISSRDVQDDEMIVYMRQGEVQQLLQVVGEMNSEARAKILQAKADGTLDSNLNEAF